jgi:hypothetical protein
MRILKAITVVIGLVLLSIGGLIIFRNWWVSHPPKIPKNLHADSVWIKGPPAPLFLAPRGIWLGCWFDAQRNVDRCQFADYKGLVLHEEDYISCDDKPPISDATLKPRDHDQSFAFVFLRDQTLLWSTTECEIMKRSGASASEWCPLCKEPFPNLKQQSSPYKSR